MSEFETSKEMFRFYVNTEFKSGTDTQDVIIKLKGVWNDQCPENSTIYRWILDFKKETRSSFEDAARSGRPSLITDELLLFVQAVIVKILE